MKHVTLSKAQQDELRHYHETNKALSPEEVAKWAKVNFSLSQAPSTSSVYKMYGRNDHSASKRKRELKFQEVDTALSNWILQCEHNNFPTNEHTIRLKGRQFAHDLGIAEDAMKFSNGWLQSFKARHNFKCYRRHGEKGDANVEGLAEAMPGLQDVIKRYDPCDVFNMDETGLFYRMPADKTISRNAIPGLKKEKSRITVAFAVNADGSERLIPFFIGNAKQPRCFGYVFCLTFRSSHC